METKLKKVVIVEAVLTKADGTVVDLGVISDNRNTDKK